MKYYNRGNWDVLRLQKGMITKEEYIKRNPNTLLSKIFKKEKPQEERK